MLEASRVTETGAIQNLNTRATGSQQTPLRQRTQCAEDHFARGSKVGRDAAPGLTNHPQRVRLTQRTFAVPSRSGTQVAERTASASFLLPSLAGS